MRDVFAVAAVDIVSRDRERHGKSR